MRERGIAPADKARRVVGIASDMPFPEAGRPVVSIDDIEAIADLMIAKAEDLETVLGRAEAPTPEPQWLS